MNRLRLVLAFHDHQPVGNFDGVFEDALRDSYAPLLNVLADYPDIPIVLHTSGSLLEWLVARHPEYIDRVRGFVERGQIEILGGPFYEPILACIPSRDRIGQIELYSEYLQRLFGTPIRGMWVPERVWEQNFASDIAAAGIEYTMLDDFHFRNSGLDPEELHGYYLTEDEGRLLKIFPDSEPLRYKIPFAEVHETFDYLRDIAQRHAQPIVVFGDDGEKFGTWPGTKELVYGKGWLRKFFDTLRENQDWLQVCTLADAVRSVPPIGKIYLPDASYREMTEWALPVPRQIEYSQVVHRHQTDQDWSQLRQFMRGGFWRNFRVKYPEANEMYCRMLEVSQKLEELEQTSIAEEAPELLAQARTALYRAQCNCPYWHGAFGGLYLPHLRNAIYHHLIQADNLLEQAAGRNGHWTHIVAEDFNLDARKEIRLSGDRLVAYLSPSRGGVLYELDIRQIKHNLLATLNRRPEPYHERILAFAQKRGTDHLGKVAAINDEIKFKQPDLDRKLIYDNWTRKSLVDHFFQPGLTSDQIRQGQGLLSDFHAGPYETLIRRTPQRVEARMWREGQVGPYRVKLTKTISLDASSGGNLLIAYELENLPAGLPFHFGVEFQFAGMAAGASDRYYYDERGHQMGQLEGQHDLSQRSRIGLVDEWLGVDASLDLSLPGGIWTYPIETISQSEGGFEAVHQSSTVIPHWEFLAPADGRWSVELTLSVDTSIAQARQLREAAVVS